MYFCLNNGLYKDNQNKALEDKLVADAASKEVQIAQLSWICHPKHLAPEMELVR